MGAATLESEDRERSADLASGTIVGDYRIEATIGSGGMATVYQALQPIIGKRVAIKVMHRTKSDTAVSRFVKEARAVNLIGHPNIVDVFNFGMTSNGRPYLVMELLIGETLAVRAKRGAIPIAETCNVLIEVSHALEAAHEAGIVHRDLKPENVFLAKRKDVLHVKLLDFGIAKLFGDGELGGEDTRPGVLIGTPRYISPEQVRGVPLDGRVDIYALGVVAFELLTGRPPFTASSAFDLFQKHSKLRPPTPSAFNAALTPEADDLIGAMLAKEPGDRPSLAEIRKGLSALRATPVSEARASVAQATDVLPVAPPVATSHDATAVRYTGADTSDTATAPVGIRARHRFDRRILGGMVIAAIAGGIVAFVVTRPQPERAIPAWTPPPMPVARPQPVPAPKPPPTPTPIAAEATSLATDDDESSIEIDPVTHVAKPVKRAKPRVRKPRPAAATPPPAAPEKPAAPDDDAVRSPFEHAP